MYILIPKLSRFLQLSKIKNKVNLGPKLYFPFFLVHCLREERENGRISIVERKGHHLHRSTPQKKVILLLLSFFRRWEFILCVLFPLNLPYMVDPSPQIILVLGWLWVFKHFFWVLFLGNEYTFQGV